jgi:hypothetical protein
VAPRRRAGLSFREIGEEETLILTEDGSTAVVLNAVGGVLWSLCDGSREVEELAAIICSAFPAAEPGGVRDDVAAVVTQLRSLGLLEEHEPCGTPPSAR